MSHLASAALREQCERRLDSRIPPPSFETEAQRIRLMERVARKVAANRSRYPDAEKVPPDPVTGVADSYVDDVITHAIAEGPWYDALRANDTHAWEELVEFVTKRVCYHPRILEDPMITTDDIAEYAHICMSGLLVKLPSYRFDCTLKAWVRKFVIYEVNTIVNSRKNRDNKKAGRLEDLVGQTPAAGIDGSDDPALAQVVLDLNFDLMEVIDQLSQRERDVVYRLLLGDEPAKIACDMGLSRSTIYSTRSNAYKRLRAILAR